MASLGLASFVHIMFVTFIHVVMEAVVCSFSLLDNSPLNAILFIHSSVDGDLSCLQFGAVTNSAFCYVYFSDHICVSVLGHQIFDYLKNRDENWRSL